MGQQQKKKLERRVQQEGEPAKAPMSGTTGFVLGVGLVLIGAGILFWWRDSQKQQPTPQVAAPAPVTAPVTATEPNEPPPLPIPEFPPADVAAAERISLQDAKKLLEEGKAVAIDVRDVDSYKSSHIPGALQIPLGYVQGEIQYFPKDKKLITYCT